MLEKFIEHLTNLGINSQDKILLAVSGGMDSMVMTHLFLEAKFQIEIAHVNYMLRDDESNLDEALVRKFATDNEIVFHLKKIDTNTYAQQEKLGIQEAARNIRYHWFDELLKNNTSLKFLATAHHKNDNAETMIFNITRGGGFAAMKGIVVKRGKIIRPLLFASKADVTNYARINTIDYREDQSNKSTKYSRNRIRHLVIPELQKINPGLVEMLSKKSKIYQQGITIIEETINNQISSNVTREGKILKIPVSFIQESKYANLLVWQLVKDYKFTSPQVEEIIVLCNSPSGKKIVSETHQFTRDRSYFILSELIKTDFHEELYYDVENLIESFKGEIQLVAPSEIEFGNTKNEAYFDLNKIEFPIKVRIWKPGDKISPLGMGGKSQKISDLLVQQKISVVDKEKVKVLVFNNTVSWVIGMRVSNKYKIDSNTKKALKMTFT